MDSKIRQLKEQLVTIYTNECMTALKNQGVNVGDGGRFYDKLFDLIDDSILFGDLRI